MFSFVGSTMGSTLKKVRGNLNPEQSTGVFKNSSLILGSSNEPTTGFVGMDYANFQLLFDKKY